MNRMLAPLGGLAMLCGCAVQVGEKGLLRPQAAPALQQAQLTGLAAAYSLEHHSIAAADGAKLDAVHLRRPGNKLTLLYFGGNNFVSGRQGGGAAMVAAALGVDLIIVDHRGYGQSEGTPTFAALLSDGLAAYDAAVKFSGVTPGRLVVHGQSLGSFAAGHVAANRDTAGVVLESSVTTAEDWVASQTGGAPVSVKVDPVLRGQGNLSKVAGIDEPLLLLVGRGDTTTPPRFSEKLYSASPLPAGRKQIAIVDGAGHNDVLAKVQGVAAYRSFLSRVVQAVQ